MITAREMVMRVNVLRQKTAPMTEADKAEMEDLRKMAVDMQEKRQCAAAHLRMALALKPRHQHALEAIGELGSDLCCSSPEWMQRFNAKEYERKGKICFARHDWTGALANFTKCLEIDPECSGFAWHARGMAYFFYKEERGEADLDTTTTLKSFRKAVELDGDNEVFRCNYAARCGAPRRDGRDAGGPGRPRPRTACPQSTESAPYKRRWRRGSTTSRR